MLIVTITPAAAEHLITGTAVYDLALDRDDAGLLVGVEGLMTSTVTRDCEVFSTELDLKVSLLPEDGAAIPMTIRSSHVEEEDELTFDIHGTLAGTDTEMAAGSATRSASGLSVALTKPEEGTFELDREALFPVALTKAVLESAEEGERLVEFPMFDGSGAGKEVWRVSAVIGEAETVADDDASLYADGLGFGDMARWPITFSYFPPDADGATVPAFSYRALVYRNGFTPTARYDFGVFALRATLTEITPVPPIPCPGTTDQSPRR
ncbi:EipB family protein [Bauldia sp.]|uniref:EipB family protein n=1 Tax=Bauldia sp. TaxID=2575872 RepID=UPI003BABA25E